VLNAVLLWLVLLPLVAMTLSEYILSLSPTFQSINKSGVIWGETDLRPVFLLIAMQIAFSLFLIWGVACILLVGKRVLSANGAGRNRTSFRVVRKEARKYVLTLFFTGILRTCITILWTLLLIIPGIIYSLRTIFYHITIVCEGKEYRSALHKSISVVRGHTWKVFWYMLGLGFSLFVPAIFIT